MKFASAIPPTTLLFLAGLVSRGAIAGMSYKDILWTNGDSAGQIAAYCYTSFPDERPFAVPRTLIIDQNMPNGTVVFEWGYGGDFLSDFAVVCNSTGVTNNDGGGRLTESIFQSNHIRQDHSKGQTGVYGLYTSLSGLELRIIVRTNSSQWQNPGGTSPSSGGELALNDVSATGLRYYPSQLTSGVGVWTHTSFTGSASIRAQLVKQGTVSYGTLTVPNDLFIIRQFYGDITDYLAGTGITVIPPACRLKTTDYTIPMDIWGLSPSAQAYGPLTQVNLSLECQGKVSHVRFRFEDTGTSPSADNNISLYDSAGGNKIDGLEIELLYNGSKVSIDNTTLTDTGSHGAIKSTPADNASFGSTSTAPFQARYVQKGTSVTRAGDDYSGPVTGKVNMYVTYD